MRKLILIVLVSVVCIIGGFYWGSNQANATLTDNITTKKQVDDFTLHIRIEKIDDGFQVFRSIQYTGDESVEIEHQTPLVSVSLKNKNHDFTGSNVTKVLGEGNSYYPQNAKVFTSQEEGEYPIYFHARFTVNGECFEIEHVHELILE
ncbi:hypothetical protein ACFQ3N_11690 [Virgibacillus byunsanensis]|uniref:YtkA-like domain-containing protein n=1 Tax=Virgibacillus byunsanensis TaxID=570945 RepID=A0ABW3LKW5_9BACI